MRARACPGKQADGTFDPDACWADYGEHEIPAECFCTNWCGDPGEAGCCKCNHGDVYAPCPVVGFGCGMDSWLPRCGCCSDEEWAAARFDGEAATK